MRSAKTRPTIRYLFDHHRADSITLNRYIESLSMPFFFFLNRCTKQQSLEIQSISALWRMNVTLQFTRKGKNMAKLNFRSLTLSESSSEMISIEKYLCDAHRKKISRALSLYVLQKISFGMAFLTHLTHARNSCCVVYIFSLLCFHCIKWPLFLFLYTNTKKDVVDVYLRVCWCFLCWYVGSEFCFWNAFPNCSLWREFVVTGYLYESLTVTTTRMCVVFHLLFLSLLSNCAH